MSSLAESTTTRAEDLAEKARLLAEEADRLAGDVGALATQAIAEGGAGQGSLLVFGLTVFILAVFVGYHVVWRVTPALHSPLVSVTNAVSSVIVVGALIAAGPAGFDFSKGLGLAAVVLASINIFGGFIVTQRMLSMYKKRG